MGSCSSKQKITDFESQSNQASDSNDDDFDDYNNEFDEWINKINNLRNNEQLELYALARKRTEFESIDDLIDYIFNSPAENDLEKAWVVYVWITENIKYDVTGYKLSIIGETDPNSLILNGKGFSEGYSSLFEYLCNSLGIECKKIIGYSKGFSYEIGSSFRKTNHSWNIVKLDKKWEYVDTTWGAGAVTDEYQLKGQFSPYYFLTPAHIFIYDHYNESYQFQNRQITLREYEDLPWLELNYHLLGFKCVSHKKSLIEESTNPIVMIFSAPNTSKMIANLTKKTDEETDYKIENAILLQRNPLTDLIELKIAMPTANEYLSLQLFGKSEYDSLSKDMFDSIAQFKLSTTQRLINNIPSSMYKFVKLCEPENVEFYIFNPISYMLYINRPYNFKFYIKDAIEVAMVLDKPFFPEWVNLNQDEFEMDYWILKRAFDKLDSNLKLTIFARFNENESFKGICIYFVK